MTTRVIYVDADDPRDPPWAFPTELWFLPHNANTFGECMVAPRRKYILAGGPDPRDEVIKRLMEALEPFADALGGNYSYQSDALCISMGHGKDDLRWCLPLGDFRRARAALTFAKEQLK